MKINGNAHIKFKIGVAYEELKARLDAAGYEYESNIDLDDAGHGHAYFHLLRFGKRIQTIHICSHSDNVDPECCEPIYRFITVYNYEDDPRSTNGDDLIPEYYEVPTNDLYSTVGWPVNTIKYTNTDGLINEFKCVDGNIINAERTPYSSIWNPLEPSLSQNDIDKVTEIIWKNNQWYNTGYYQLNIPSLVKSSGVTYVAKVVDLKPKFVIPDYWYCSDATVKSRIDPNAPYTNYGRIRVTVTSENKEVNCPWTICPYCLGTGTYYYLEPGGGHIGGIFARDCQCPKCNGDLNGVIADNIPSEQTYQGRTYINDFTSQNRVMPYQYAVAAPQYYTQPVLPEDLEDHVNTTENGDSYQVTSYSLIHPTVWQQKYYDETFGKAYGIWFEFLEDESTIQLKASGYESVNGGLAEIKIFNTPVKCHYKLTKRTDVGKDDEVVDLNEDFLPGIASIHNPEDIVLIEREFITNIPIHYNAENKKYILGDPGYDELETFVTIEDTFEIDCSKITIKLELPITELEKAKWDLNTDKKVYSNGFYESSSQIGKYHYVGFDKEHLTQPFPVVTKYDLLNQQMVHIDMACKSKTFDYPWDYDAIMNFVKYQDLNKPIDIITSDLQYAIGNNPMQSVLNRSWSISPCEIDNDFNLKGRFMIGYWNEDTPVPENKVANIYDRFDALYHYHPDVLPITQSTTGPKGIEQCTLPYYEGIYKSGNKDAYIWLQTAGLKDNVKRRVYTGKFDTVELKNIDDKIAFQYENEFQSIYYRENFNNGGDLRCGSACYPYHSQAGKSDDIYVWDRAVEPDGSNIYTAAAGYSHIYGSYRTGFANETYLSRVVQKEYCSYKTWDNKYRHLCPSCSACGQYGVTLYRNLSQQVYQVDDYDYTSIYETTDAKWNIYDENTSHADRAIRGNLNASQYLPSYRTAAGANSYSDRGFSENNFNDTWRCPTCRGSGVKVKYLYYKHDVILDVNSDPDIIQRFKNNALLYEFKQEPETFWYWDGISWSRQYLGYNSLYTYTTCTPNWTTNPITPNVTGARSDTLYKMEIPCADCVSFSAWSHTLGWCPIEFDADAINETWTKNKNFTELNYFEKEDYAWDRQKHLHLWDKQDTYQNGGVDDFKDYNNIVDTALYQECTDCSGTGYIDDEECPTCNGNTWIQKKFTEAYSIVLCTTCDGTGIQVCGHCHGTGLQGTELCENCAGEGVIKCSKCNGMKLLAEFGDSSSMVGPDRNNDKKIYKYTIRKAKKLENISIEMERIKYKYDTHLTDKQLPGSTIPPGKQDVITDATLEKEDNDALLTENDEIIEIDMSTTIYNDD